MAEALSITILHKLNNRVRLHLSSIPEEHALFLDQLHSIQGVKSVKFSYITQNLVLLFDSSLIKLEEVIIQVALSYTTLFGDNKVTIYSQQERESTSAMASNSAIMLLASLFLRQFAMPTDVLAKLDLLTAAMTGIAVLEHAFHEVQKKGEVDPEVLSIVYLASSVTKKNYLQASAVTWIATFGRHLLENRSFAFELSFTSNGQDAEGKELYNVEVLPSRRLNKDITFFEFLQTLISSHATGSKDGSKPELVRQVHHSLYHRTPSIRKMY